MATTEIVNETVFERVITGFREEEFYFEGFETQSVVRQSNKLTWVMHREYDEEQTITGTQGKLGDDIAVHVYYNYKMEEGDEFIFTYTLIWWWHGRGDDPVRLPLPVPGATLCFEVVAA